MTEVLFSMSRGSFDMVHFHYGPSVPFPQLPTSPRGDAVEFMVRREQSNSTGGTLTHVSANFTGAAFLSIGGAKLFRVRGVFRCRLLYFAPVLCVTWVASSRAARVERRTVASFASGLLIKRCPAI